MKPVLAILLALSLAGCFSDNDRDDKPDNIGLQSMPYRDNTLGWTQIAQSDKWRMRTFLADVLRDEVPDTDKDVRVLIHEFGKARAMDESPTGGLPRPPGYGPHWYVHSGDTKEMYAPVPPEEGAWFASWRRIDVHVLSDHAWLIPTTQDAIARINMAAGKECFRLVTPAIYYFSVIWVVR